jgi:hypothetical protein
LDWAGVRNLRQFAQRNESWPLRAWAGIVLEAVVDGHLPILHVVGEGAPAIKA